MKLRKRIPLIDQHDKSGFWGGKFGGNFIPETLKKPVEDLTILFEKLRYDKKFLKQRDYYFKNYIGSPTSLTKLQNLSDHLNGAQIYAKMVSEANGGAHKIYNATVHCLIAKKAGKKYVVGDTGAGYAGKMLSMAAKKFGLKCKIFMGVKDMEFNELADIVLFDSKGYEKSMSFDHQLIKNLKINKELMLAGNIQIDDNLENFQEIVDIVDISGGLETSGLKDISKIDIFLEKIKQINDET